MDNKVFLLKVYLIEYNLMNMQTVIINYCFQILIILGFLYKEIVKS